MGMRTLDRVSSLLHMSLAQSQVTVVGLQSAFEINGKQHTFEDTARIVVKALRQQEWNDPDVRYATEWLADLTKKSTAARNTAQRPDSKRKTGTEQGYILDDSSVENPPYRK